MRSRPRLSSARRATALFRAACPPILCGGPSSTATLGRALVNQKRASMLTTVYPERFGRRALHRYRLPIPTLNPCLGSPKVRPVIPTGAARLFSSRGLRTTCCAAEESWQSIQVSSRLEGTKHEVAFTTCFFRPLCFQQLTSCFSRISLIFKVFCVAPGCHPTSASKGTKHDSANR